MVTDVASSDSSHYVSTIERDALGTTQDIGDFYNARRDTFVHGNLFAQDLTKEERNLKDADSTKMNYHFTTSTKEKLSALEIEGEISLSFLAGLVSVGGSAKFLKNAKSDEKRVHYVYTQHVRTTDEKVYLERVAGKVTKSQFPEEATHVVIGIKRGLNALVDISCSVDEDENEMKIKGALEGVVKKVAQDATAKASGEYHSKEKTELKDITIDIFADVETSSEHISNNGDFSKIVEKVAKQMEQSAKKGGVPLSYTLLDIRAVAKSLGGTLVWNAVFNSLSVSNLMKANEILCEREEQLLKISKLKERVDSLSNFLPKNTVAAVRERFNQCKVSAEEIKRNLAELIPKVRGNPENLKELTAFFESFESSPLKESKMSTFFEENNHLIDFLRFLEKLNGTNVILIASSGDYKDMKRTKAAHVLFYSLDYLSTASSLWNKTTTHFFNLCERKDKNWICAAVNTHLQPQITEIEEIAADSPRIVSFKDQAYITRDLVGLLGRLERHNVVRTSNEEVDKDHGKDPLKLTEARIPCPKCRSSDHSTKWYCSECYLLLEYDLSDHFYCGCGRSPVENFSFKCSHDEHGVEFTEYDEKKLKEELGRIRPPEHVNIVVLGESRMEKEKFINSLVTLLHRESLDEVETVDLHCLIPPPHRGRHSAKEKAGKYFIKREGVVYCLIDTSDMDFTLKSEEEMTAERLNLVKFIGELGEIHHICCLLSSKKKAEVFLLDWLHLFHEKAKENFSFVMKEDEDQNSLQDLLKNIPLEGQNVFHFDNRWISHFDSNDEEQIEEEEELKKIFVKSRKTALQFFHGAYQSPSQSAEESGALMFARVLFQKLNSVHLEEEKRLKEMKEDLERKREEKRLWEESLKEMNERRKIVISFRNRIVRKEATLCKKCSRKIELSGEQRRPYIEEDAEVEAFDPYTVFDGISIPQGENCRKCGEGFERIVCSSLIQREREYKEKTNSQLLQRIQQTRDNLENVKNDLVTLENVAKEIEEETDSLAKILVDLAHFVRNNSILPFNTKLEEYLKHLTASSPNLRKSMSERVEKHVEFRNAYEKFVKMPQVTNVEFGNMPERIGGLEELSHCGEKIKKIKEELIKIVPSHEENSTAGSKIFVAEGKLHSETIKAGEVKRSIGLN